MLFTSLGRLLSRMTDWLGHDRTRGPTRADPGLMAEPPDSEAPFDPYATLTDLHWLWDSPEPQEPNPGTGES